MQKLLLLLILLFPAIAYATSYNTDSTPTQAEVATLITDASAGDTIVFQGNATWSSGCTVGKAITIDGNGYTLTSSGSLSSGFFRITGFTASSLVRITGFTFSMASASYGIMVEAMTGGPSNGNIRIDHNTFHLGGQQVYFYHGKGIVDNNYFYNGVKAMDCSAGTRADADSSWSSLALPTVDAIFIEDNHFVKNGSWPGGGHQECIGTENGGKLVIRYNSWDFTEVPDKGETVYPFMAHGNAAAGDTPGYWQRSSGCRRGQATIEFYENTITISSQRMDFFYQTRGSVNFVYNNSVIGTATINPRIYLWEEEYTMDDWSSALRTAWPAEDQVHNSFIWNNTYRGADFNAGTYGYVESSPNTNAGLLKDRDFFLHAPCAAGDSVDAYGNTCTHGKATFTDANGAAGSHPTDGDPYTNEGTMTFSDTGDNAYLDYTPYTYPHPLRGESAPYAYGSGKRVGGGSSGGVFR